MHSSDVHNVQRIFFLRRPNHKRWTKGIHRVPFKNEIRVEKMY